MLTELVPWWLLVLPWVFWLMGASCVAYVFWLVLFAPTDVGSADE